MQIPNSLPIPRKDELWGIVDSTKLQSFCSCPRQFFYEYVLGWRPEASSNHLIFGQAWHEALEHLYRTSFKEVAPAFELFLEVYRKEFPETTDGWFKGKSPQNAMLALVEYAQMYASDLYDFQVLDSEVGGLVSIQDSEGNPSKVREMAVKLDLIVQKEDTIFALEHKTGSQCGESWARQWKLSIQIGAYLHALLSAYPDQNVENTSVVVNGTFFYTKERKFLRVPCLRSSAAMLDWLSTVNTLYSRIEDNFYLLSTQSDKDTVLEAFPKHPTACNNYAGCKYHDLCVCVQNPLRLVGDEPPIGYTLFWWNPLESVENSLHTKGAS